MSKRYGRQQKRKARNRINALQSALALEKSMHNALRERSRQDRNAVELTAEVLGNYFVSLPPQEQHTLDAGMLDIGFRMAKVGSLNNSFRYGVNSMAAQIQAEQVAYVLSCLRYTGSHIDELSQSVHIRFKLNGKPIGYGFTEQAFRYMSRDSATQRVSDELALTLTERMPHFRE